MTEMNKQKKKQQSAEFDKELIIILIPYTYCVLGDFQHITLGLFFCCCWKKCHVFTKTLFVLSRGAWSSKLHMISCIPDSELNHNSRLCLLLWATRSGLLAFLCQPVCLYWPTTFWKKKKMEGWCFLQSSAWVNEMLLSHWFTQMRMKV